jgi:hypothetical protein
MKLRHIGQQRRLVRSSERDAGGSDGDNGLVIAL